MKKMILTILAAGAALAAQAEWASNNGVSVYTNEANWQAAMDAKWGGESIYNLNTTAGNMALADEVSSAPSDNANMGKTLTFDKANTGFEVSFDLYASSAVSGNGFVFNDVEDADVVWTDALSVGDIDGAENDNFYLRILGGDSIFGSAYDILGNTFEAGENLDISDSSGLIASFDVSTLTESSMFFGIISDSSYNSVFFDEDAGGDDMAIADIKIVAIPEPSVLALVGFFGTGIIGIRRFFLI